MNFFPQDSTGLLGTRKAVEELSLKEKVKLLVLSDSHNNYYAFETALMAKGKDCDAMVFCGDGINDLVLAVNKASSDPAFNEVLPPVIAFVQGNNDPSAYVMKNFSSDSANGPLSFFQLQVPSAINFCAAGHNVLAVHGHRHSVYSGNFGLQETASACNAELVFFGHTHIPEATLSYPKNLYLNPGSVSRPRSNEGATFATVEINKNNSDFLYTIWKLNNGNPVPAEI